ncbi:MULTISPECIES: HNH endonuclease signature motif containing protein [unclassified Rhodococcus (in: high G+C Gram-positive bacteria)]|uniref:HNH endonuclease signature motif containing protein n=1 Tax=unclassified Rhodococcus (in: high G+C Gram-positive bacteria) TaxID=192944 RepID=UPI001C3C9625|nr:MULTISPECIES: HNH endonuclease signature motif containing protein [unclassified Rhodococcus (in: high G+C Gram-positive bacteria)]
MTITNEQRFWNKVNKHGPVSTHRPDLGPCWLWNGTTASGYGQFSLNGKQPGAHRVSYEYEIGPIPDGLHLDHLCRVLLCVNPAHLEPVTSKVNTERGISAATARARHAAITACPNGHFYTSVNARVDSRGHRHCRTCDRARARGTDPKLEPLVIQVPPPRSPRHCPHGHEFTPENTALNNRGSRYCRECNRIKKKAQYVARKAAMA